MKSISIVIVALVGVLCSLMVSAADPPTDNATTLDMTEKINKIRADYQKMKADDKVDDQKFIADVQTLANQLASDLKNASTSLPTPVLAEVTAIQSKIVQMTTAGKFDPTVLQLFKGVVKASKAGGLGAAKNATNVS